MTTLDATPPPATGRVPARARQWGRAWLRGWPAVVQLATDLVAACVYFWLGIGLIIGLVLIPVLFSGLLVIALVLFVAVQLGHAERARLWALTGVEVPPQAPPSGPRPLWRRLLLDSRSWRALLYAGAKFTWGITVGTATVVFLGAAIALATLPLYGAALPDATVALPGVQVTGWGWIALLTVAGLAALAAAPFLARGLVLFDVTLTRWLLGPGSPEQVARLTQRVETLDRARTATVDSVELERRRIERDLHDGPQQRLVAIAMNLGMAQEKLGKDEDGTRELLDRAHAAAKEAIVDMRMVARGIHPPVLTHRGLEAALAALVARCPVPVRLAVDVPQRPPATVEAIAYFSVSEALTNVAKHARATAARVDVRARDGRLDVHVSDNGLGGADPSRGTGLTGLADRARSVDGTLTVSSPAGGPTVLDVSLPLSSRPGSRS